LSENGDLATYPTPGVNYYGFNLANIRDLNQRRAMALVLDRRAVIRAYGGRAIPATGFIPPGMPGFGTITQDFLSAGPELADARQFMRRARHPKLSITLYLNDAPDVARTGALTQESWAKLGITTKIKVLEWAQFVDAVGPPPRQDVDVVQIGWVNDYLDAYDFFQILSCRNENNWWNFCDPTYEKLLRQASRTVDSQARERVYARLEERLTGPEGLLPIVPKHWFTVDALEKATIRKTFNVNPQYYVDLAAVVPTG